VAELCEYVIVMYAGKVVERSPVMDLFDAPTHPYSKVLLEAAFGLGDMKNRKPITGEPPDLADLPPGCSFHPRCLFADQRCRQEEPPEECLTHNRWVKCWRPIRT
jgi:oligopeptide/dipeptide ABC transporter ATP-binding protein